MVNEFKGLSLFNDIADAQLQTNNRAAVLTNVFQDNYRNGKVSPKGASLLLGYFDKIIPSQRKQVQEQFVITMKERGFELN